MTSRRKLEEEIARSKDPELRKQLQALLAERERRSKERSRKLKKFFRDIGIYP